MIETIFFFPHFLRALHIPAAFFHFQCCLSIALLVSGLLSFGLSYISFSPFLTGISLGWCFFPVLFMVKFAAELLPVTFLPSYLPLAANRSRYSGMMVRMLSSGRIPTRVGFLRQWHFESGH